MTETLHIHHLAGCAPSPLAHYLKALGILRLVADQADPDARGWWQGERFHLLTRLDRDALADFFLRRYAPTPIIAPWNNGSGFYKRKSYGLSAIATSHSHRFADYRRATEFCFAYTRTLAEAPSEEAKSALLRICREQWRGTITAWLDAAIVLQANGAPVYPAILGTGGNDGSLDFTRNFMDRLADIFDLTHPDALPCDRAHSLLSSALWGHVTYGLSSDTAIGQFMPGGAGGANQTSGFGADSLINPWDFVLMLEGALVFYPVTPILGDGRCGAAEETEPSRQ